jgi:hypothetical protein
MKLRSDMELPSDRKSTRLLEDPSRAYERMLIAEPSDAKSSADIELPRRE